MHDVIVLYNRPADPEAFDAHYRNTHIPLVDELPNLREFAWGKVVDGDVYLVARMTYDNAAEAAASMESAAGVAAVDDLGNFAHAGVTVLNVDRGDGR
ncbi:EthD family reductase [Mycobacterium sp. SMC-4]|uniref:EthD family reductase n=1 Tax=Mycobacterium sp. SMC-4 TaxID=2857059 RepID=UPI003CFFBB5A